MARKIVLSTDLSAEGFKKLEEQIKQLEKDVENYQRRLMTLSLREIRKIARRNVVSRVGQTGYKPTGELANSFKTVRLSKDVGVLLNIHDNAAAVEFGTGIPGASSAHPVAGERGYTYGEKPWWVYNDGMNFWRTSGQTGKRFMYDALIEFKEMKLNEVSLRAWDDTIGKGIK